VDDDNNDGDDYNDNDDDIKTMCGVDWKRVLKNALYFLLGNSPASEFRRRGITQKKRYNIQNTAKVWNQKCIIYGHLLLDVHISLRFSLVLPPRSFSLHTKIIIDYNYSWFQTFAVFWMFYSFFWVISWRLNFICRRFGTLCLFHLHRRVGMKKEWL